MESNMLNLCDIVVKGAIKDYYWACKRNDEEEKKELTQIALHEGYNKAFLKLLDIAVDPKSVEEITAEIRRQTEEM